MSLWRNTLLALPLGFQSNSDPGSECPSQGPLALQRAYNHPPSPLGCRDSQGQKRKLARSQGDVWAFAHNLAVLKAAGSSACCGALSSPGRKRAEPWSPDLQPGQNPHCRRGGWLPPALPPLSLQVSGAALCVHRSPWGSGVRAGRDRGLRVDFLASVTSGLQGPTVSLEPP